MNTRVLPEGGPWGPPFLQYKHSQKQKAAENWTLFWLLQLIYPIYTTYISMSVSVLVAQLCPTLCDPMDFRSPGSSVHGILQARILKWVAIPFSGESSWPRGWTWVSFIADRLFFGHTPHLVRSQFSDQGLNPGFLHWEVQSPVGCQEIFLCVCIYVCPFLSIEKEMATHSSILAWKIPWTEKPGQL